MALLNYRTTPLDCGKSPAELLMNRAPRTRLPRAATDAAFLAHKDKTKQKLYYDVSAKPLQPLRAHDVVRIRTGKAWEPRAAVVQQVAPHSYDVLTEDGATYRRNRRDLLVTREPFVPSELGVPDAVPSYRKPGHILHAPTPTPSVDYQESAQPSLRHDSAAAEEHTAVPTAAATSSNLPSIGQPYTTKSGRAVKRPDRWLESC